MLPLPLGEGWGEGARSYGGAEEGGSILFLFCPAKALTLTLSQREMERQYLCWRKSNN